MLYLHPKTSITDAAVHAFDHGARLTTKAGRVAVVKGRDHNQYAKALKCKALQDLARKLTTA